MRAAADFLGALIAAVPYRIHAVLADNGIQFADLPKNRTGPTARSRGQPFSQGLSFAGIEHRWTKPNHPWTNGQVERMNRTELLIREGVAFHIEGLRADGEPVPEPTTRVSQIPISA